MGRSLGRQRVTISGLLSQPSPAHKINAPQRPRNTINLNKMPPMFDPRLEKLASVLVQYSTRVKPGDLVRIAGPPASRPLLVAIYRAAIAAGGNPFVQMTPDECAQIKLREGSDDQLRFENPLEQHVIETIDVSISLWGDDNTKALSGVDPARQAVASQARRKYMAAFFERAAAGKLRWVGAQCPCHAAAQDAEMSLSDYEDFVFRATLVHLADPVAAWREVQTRQQKLVDYLNQRSEIRFVTPQGTDLTLGVEGRTWINCAGGENMPDGEVFTGPIEDATNGVVAYHFPAVYHGRQVDEVRLRFEHGKVVDASAARGEEFLFAMLDQDAGGRILGEAAIGTNYSIDRHTCNTLFDEKIGGTFHCALGAAYPESGGQNTSGLHWDMVCDLRQGGQIFADGELISENGRFLNAEWPRP